MTAKLLKEIDLLLVLITIELKMLKSRIHKIEEIKIKDKKDLDDFISQFKIFSDL